MASTLTMPQFIVMLEEMDQRLADLQEDDVMNLLVNLLKRAVDRHGSYPLYVIDALIDVLDARLLFDHSLAPGSRRVDN